jgi:hypothetical protein
MDAPAPAPTAGRPRPGTLPALACALIAVLVVLVVAVSLCRARTPGAQHCEPFYGSWRAQRENFSPDVPGACAKRPSRAERAEREALDVLAGRV